MRVNKSCELTAIADFPLVQPGDDLVEMIGRFPLQDDDILMVAQKIVSKSEGRMVALDSVKPSTEARQLATRVEKDPRLVELILAESAEIVRASPGLLIVRHRLGFTLANAGIDASNVAEEEHVLLLPEAPDASARRLRNGIKATTEKDVGVIITDSWGRPWRMGTVGFAIGVAGLPAVIDLCGQPDLNGRELQATTIGIGDELAAAASLLMGQADEATPVIVVRGLSLPSTPGSANDLVRPHDSDAFR
ncbi:MAG: coenzyme F420-0:L-glutamate ligase [Gammaproteobacteria bacterium]|nr:coenzyme F420-0:L-glutamate ligase [Gammaproteobacteria bacterium]